MSLAVHLKQETFRHIASLRDRSFMLAEARNFFSSKGILEVDVPSCTSHACVDENIDLMTVHTSSGEIRYLQSSPEYGMKRLLSEGIGDIYYIGHVFRDSEIGPKHNPEFTMAEWYRCDFTYEEMIQETISFIELFLGSNPCRIISYHDAMLKYTGIDFYMDSNQTILSYLDKNKLGLSPSLLESSRDDLLNIIMGCCVEPCLGIEEFTVIKDFPSSQSALAEVEKVDGELVAKRFEVYYSGQELANGYRELRDPSEQKQRLLKSNELRMRKGKKSLPVDPYFLDALHKGLPTCCGVAVGFDRLMMLRHKTQEIKDVLAYSWSES